MDQEDFLILMSNQIKAKGFIDENLILDFEKKIHSFNKSYYLKDRKDKFIQSNLSYFLTLLNWTHLENNNYIYFLKTINKFFSTQESINYGISYWETKDIIQYNNLIISNYNNVFLDITNKQYKDEIKTLSIILKDKFNFYVNFILSIPLSIEEVYLDKNKFDKNNYLYYEFFRNYCFNIDNTFNIQYFLQNLKNEVLEENNIIYLNKIAFKLNSIIKYNDKNLFIIKNLKDIIKYTFKFETFDFYSYIEQMKYLKLYEEMSLFLITKYEKSILVNNNNSSFNNRKRL